MPKKPQRTKEKMESTATKVTEVNGLESEGQNGLQSETENGLHAVSARVDGEQTESETDRAEVAIKKKHPESETVIVQYRPYAGMERWFKNRFSAWNTPKAWFAGLLVILFFGYGGPGFVLQSIVYFLASPGTIGTVESMNIAATTNTVLLQVLFFAIIFFLTLVAFIYARHPSHLAFSPRGISLIWHRGILWKAKTFSWHDMREISVVWPKGKTSPQDALICFPLAVGKALNLRFGALSTIDSRQKLLNAIERYAGGLTRSVELSDMLAPPQNHNYTELWLQALSAPPRRERLTPLPEGGTLRDGRYIVRGQLGVGGQGTAYLAQANDLDHEVVLKEFILPVYVDANIRRQALEKMQHEAEILRRLDDQRIVKLIDFFIEDHRGYLVLERIDGVSLRQKVSEQGPFKEERVRQLAAEMCLMLTYLHGLEPPVVHRDFTPDNLILEHEGILKLVDFNVAQQKDTTATGTVVGKHCYISPEQFRGKPTPQSDIYAMGATLFYLLTGEDPEPITSSRPQKLVGDISDEFNEIVAKATSLDPRLRYQNIGELLADLEK